MTPVSSAIRIKAPTRNTVGVGAAQLADIGNVHGVILKAMCPGHTIYIGADATVTTANGYPMADGETLTLEIRNANQLYAISDAAAQSLAVVPFQRY